MNKKNWERYRELRDLVLDDEGDESQLAELEQFVSDDDSMKRDFAEHCQIRSAIAFPAEDSVNNQEIELDTASSAQWRLVPLLTRGGLAATVLIAMAFALWNRKERQVASLGTIVKTQKCHWEYCTLPTVPGLELQPGPLVLASGIAELRVGLVDLTLEGPVDVELISAERCFVRSGRVLAEVHPGGEGFVVQTPTSVLTDRGTVFGVSVTPWGTSDLTVIKGQVDALHVRSGKSVSAMTRDRLRLTETGIEEVSGGSFVPGAAEDNEPNSDRELNRIQISTAIGEGRDGYVMASVESPEKRSETSLLIKTPGEEEWAIPFRRRAYVHFDLSLLSGQSIAKAKLQLHGTSTDIGFLSRTLDTQFAVYGLVDESLEGWSESSLDWETSPGVLEDRISLDPRKTKLLGQFVVPQASPAGPFTISGKRLLDFLVADTNGGATLIIVSETAGLGGSYVHGFASKRHPELPPPTLRLTLAD